MIFHIHIRKIAILYEIYDHCSYFLLIMKYMKFMLGNYICILVYKFSHNTLIPYHEWSGEVEFSSHMERNSTFFHALNGVVAEYRRPDT